MADQDGEQPPAQPDVGAQALAWVDVLQAQMAAMKVLQREAYIRAELTKLKGPQFKVNLGVSFIKLYLSIFFQFITCVTH